MARIRETIERAGKGAGLNAGERRTFRNLLTWVRSNLDPGFEAE
jgi:hypothetical protein